MRWDGMGCDVMQERFCPVGRGCGGRGAVAGQGSPGLRLHLRSVTADCSAKQK